ncbi:hypothetical protein DSO57_1018792 [Entomophthora muscae]|uniref:Uncharacterized protein n=2 Tax=Entomophthora muscae TaxID=34485 RepID=A0ACC2T490_9FUNG|nr:hypothetical protein DSO57_1018791 [Entomophthora muscae]KAJ9069406.1 hypothetical protein DSO57_1018792 [Entomophthora muscae]
MKSFSTISLLIICGLTSAAEFDDGLIDQIRKILEGRARGQGAPFKEVPAPVKAQNDEEYSDEDDGYRREFEPHGRSHGRNLHSFKRYGDEHDGVRFNVYRRNDEYKYGHKHHHDFDYEY